GKLLAPDPRQPASNAEPDFFNRIGAKPDCPLLVRKSQNCRSMARSSRISPVVGSHVPEFGGW
ncbi:hypothetical protein N0B51_14745, partial [Tsuneonella sp. YG55]